MATFGRFIVITAVRIDNFQARRFRRPIDENRRIFGCKVKYHFVDETVNFRRNEIVAGFIFASRKIWKFLT